MECAPPCWQQIRPGVSTGEEVLARLHQIPWVDKESINDLRVNEYPINSQIMFSFTPQVGDVGGRIYFFDHSRVATIDLDTGYSLIVADAIRQLGEPQHISAASAMADGEYFVAALIYESKGVVVHIYKDLLRRYDNQEGLTELRPDDPIASVVYFDPGSYDEIRRMGRLSNYPNPYLDVALQCWKGFGVIKYERQP